jgi:hypothetical protein
MESIRLERMKVVELPGGRTVWNSDLKFISPGNKQLFNLYSRSRSTPEGQPSAWKWMLSQVRDVAAFARECDHLPDGTR